jgi:hypothetical protein
MLIISRFSYVVLSFTRQSYRDFKLVQRTSGGRSIFIIKLTVLLTEATMLNP